MKSKLPPVKTSKDEALNPVTPSDIPKLRGAGYSASQARVEGNPNLVCLKMSDPAIGKIPGFKSQAHAGWRYDTMVKRSQAKLPLA